MKVVFITFEMTVGGMPRVTINEAMAMKARGHTVHILTSCHNLDLIHTIPEMKNEGFRNFLPMAALGFGF